MNNKLLVEKIKKLRIDTQAPVMAIKKALEEAKGNEDKALKILKVKSLEKVKDKSGNETKAGLVEAYVHTGGKVGSLVVLTCQTDFVARTVEFQELAHEIAMQIASMNPKTVAELLEQVYIRDNKKKIKDLVNEHIAKFGENIKITNIVRYSL